MKFLMLTIAGFLFFTVLSCQNEKTNSDPKQFTLKEIKVASQSGGESNLFVSETGQVFLSWVEYVSDTTDALMFSTLVNGQWSAPKLVAQSSEWFVNWADFPSLVAFQDGGKSLAAHWLQKRTESVYDYDVRVALSKDGGDTWSSSFIPHRDSIAAEHGFVTMMPVAEDRIFATWLDGRNTKTKGGAMTIRTAEFDRDGQLYEESELDVRTCDCCQTDAARTSNGPIVVYRDRSEEEIRDIYYVRKVDGQWTSPKAVFNDNWVIPGCPVNGPAIAAQGDFVALAWFAAPDNEAQVKVVFSNDGGATFGPPVRIDEGNALGRVDVVLKDEQTALVSWMEKNTENADVHFLEISSDGTHGDSHKLLQTAHSRESGFPIMAKSGDRIFMSWTAVDSIGTRVKAGEIIF